MQRSLPGVTEFAKFLKLWLAIALLPSCTTAWPPACRAPRHNVRVALPRQRSAGTVVK